MRTRLSILTPSSRKMLPTYVGQHTCEPCPPGSFLLYTATHSYQKHHPLRRLQGPSHHHPLGALQRRHKRRHKRRQRGTLTAK